MNFHIKQDSNSFVTVQVMVLYKVTHPPGCLPYREFQGVN